MISFHMGFVSEIQEQGRTFYKFQGIPSVYGVALLPGLLDTGPFPDSYLEEFFRLTSFFPETISQGTEIARLDGTVWVAPADLTRVVINDTPIVGDIFSWLSPFALYTHVASWTNPSPAEMPVEYVAPVTAAVAAESPWVPDLVAVSYPITLVASNRHSGTFYSHCVFPLVLCGVYDGITLDEREPGHIKTQGMAVLWTYSGSSVLNMPVFRYDGLWFRDSTSYVDFFGRPVHYVNGSYTESLSVELPQPVGPSYWVNPSIFGIPVRQKRSVLTKSIPFFASLFGEGGFKYGFTMSKGAFPLLTDEGVPLLTEEGEVLTT